MIKLEQGYVSSSQAHPTVLLTTSQRIIIFNYGIIIELRKYEVIITIMTGEESYNCFRTWLVESPQTHRMRVDTDMCWALLDPCHWNRIVVNHRLCFSDLLLVTCP